MCLLHHPIWLQLVLALFGHYFWTFESTCLAQDHWWGFSTRNAHMVHIVNLIQLKMVYSLVEVSIWIAIYAVTRELQSLYRTNKLRFSCQKSLLKQLSYIKDMSRKWNSFNYLKTMDLTLTLTLNRKTLILNPYQYNMYPMVKNNAFSTFSTLISFHFWPYL